MPLVEPPGVEPLRLHALIPQKLERPQALLDALTLPHLVEVVLRPLEDTRPAFAGDGLTGMNCLSRDTEGLLSQRLLRLVLSLAFLHARPPLQESESFRRFGPPANPVI